MKKNFSVITALFLLLGAVPVQAQDVSGRAAIILGIDGMDPKLFQKFMDEGKMPHFKKLIEDGGDFKKLRTSYPPQSPVAWSSFIIGANPGKHGIFDFIHRDPNTMLPYLSITETKPPTKFLPLGPWQIPLDSGSVKNLRDGKPFWEYLLDKKITTTVGQVPANYPPTCPCEGHLFKALSGMGTPDLLGTQSSFSFYTSEEMNLKGVIGGGKIYKVAPAEGKVEAKIYGPPHPLKNPKAFPKKEDIALTIPFTVWFDEGSQMAKLSIQGQEIILKQGEFSDFVKIQFDVIPLVQHISAICRFFLKELSPNFKLYVSPLNIDPSNPAVPLSQPVSYSKELFDAVGYFYTQNMPPDTKALEHKVFSDEEFLKQIQMVFKEEEKRLDFELGRFGAGILFHYFSVLDQVSHTFWRFIDPEHPLYTPEGNKRYGQVIENFYKEFDRILEKVKAKTDSNTLLIVMSDHGFTSFRRGVNLNTIFLNKKWMTLLDPNKQDAGEFFANVDWTKTKIYNLGINAVYVNLQNREPQGAVSLDQYDRFVEEVRKMLLDYVDPKTGVHPIKHVARRNEIYKGPHVENAPDLIVGYEDGYRASWDTILGELPKEEMVDNMSTWSGDHTIYFNLVPGVVLSNQKIKKEDPSLEDIAPSVLDYVGVSNHPEIEGSSIFR